MVNLGKVFLFFYVATASVCFAQSISSTPKGVLPMGVVRTGNTVKGKCDGMSTDHVKLTIQPSCYGANLRGGGSVLDPTEGPIGLNLTITNGVNTFTSNIEFPNKITWPLNYGQTCAWNNLSTSSAIIDCDSIDPLIKAHYTCNFMAQAWFLNNYLACTRTNDPNSDGSLNKDIQCSFLYNWAGTSQAAVTSYTQIVNVANCGIQDKTVDQSASVIVSNPVSAPASIGKYAKRGKVIIDYDGLKIKKIDVTRNTATGEFVFSGKKSTALASFYQVKGIKTGPYQSFLTQKVEAGFDEYEECLDVKVAFIGQNQFCGSFYSPLMLFFDQKRPMFVGQSSFPLVAGVKMVAWPEGHSAGYFLALDELANKKIVKGPQLFGEGSGIANGFEALKKIDSNNDGMIDEKDQKFNKLVLWQDVNGNGVSEKGEVFLLKDKSVKKIMLDYKDDRRQSFGKKAEAREYATFIFGDKDSKGEIVDVWFSPIDISQGHK